MAEENIDNILPPIIWKELEEISKMDISIKQFNEMAQKTKSLNIEDKKDENVLKKDNVAVLLSAKEKKRYENLGKAFMLGANDAISDIQNAIKKKEQQSLSDKDDIASKIKNAEEKVKKEKSKKGSLFKKILIAGAVLGGIYILFSKTINSAISGMYDKIKNGMMGFGDFIKKCAGSMFSFFGNMFIKASECLNGDGVLTNVMIAIVSEFFSFTLPTLLVGLSEDLIRIIDSSFDSSLNFQSNKIEAEETRRTFSVESEGVLGELRRTTDEFLLSTEKDILFDNSLSVREQETATDKALGSFLNSFVNLTTGLSQDTQEQRETLRKWASSIALSLSNNNIASTAFYESSRKALGVFDSVLSFVKDGTRDISAEQVSLMEDFVKRFASSLNLRNEEIKAFSEMSAEDKVLFLRNLNSSLTTFISNADENIDKARRSAQNNTEESSVLSIMKDIRERMEEKGATTEINRFQEVREIGAIHDIIKGFINNTHFDDEVRNLTQTLGNKFDMILDAANKSLSGLATLVENKYRVHADELSYTASEDSNTPNAVIPESSDYKLMYIFNNVAASNESDITNNMTEFLNNSARHLETITKEITTVQKLERLMLAFCNVFLNDSVNLETSVVQCNRNLLEHMAKPIEKNNGDNVAHILNLSEGLAAMSQSPMIINGGGMVSC